LEEIPIALLIQVIKKGRPPIAPVHTGQKKGALGVSPNSNIKVCNKSLSFKYDNV
jgi:hypothetical protein